MRESSSHLSRRPSPEREKLVDNLQNATFNAADVLIIVADGFRSRCVRHKKSVPEASIRLVRLCRPAAGPDPHEDMSV